MYLVSHFMQSEVMIHWAHLKYSLTYLLEGIPRIQEAVFTQFYWGDSTLANSFWHLSTLLMYDLVVYLVLQKYFPFFREYLEMVSSFISCIPPKYLNLLNSRGWLPNKRKSTVLGMCKNIPIWASTFLIISNSLCWCKFLGQVDSFYYLTVVLY